VALVRSYGVNLNTTGFAPGTYPLAFRRAPTRWCTACRSS